MTGDASDTATKVIPAKAALKIPKFQNLQYWDVCLYLYFHANPSSWCVLSCYCSRAPKHAFIFTTHSYETESVWVMLSSVLQRNAETSNQTVKFRSAAGPEGISDGGRILLAKVMETFETTIISHRNNITCFFQLYMHYTQDLSKLPLTSVHKGQPAAGSCFTNWHNDVKPPTTLSDSITYK